MKHPFKPLKIKENPASSYDVIIIGAGIGGLISANILAQDGLKVLLLEQHYVVGGYCSSFYRKGYYFDAGSHFYPLLGNPESITGKIVRDIGATNKWKKMDPVDQFHLPDKSTFSVPADLDTYLKKIKKQFPESVAQIDKYFDAVREAYLFGLLHYFKGKTSKQFKKFENFSLKDMLDKHIDDPKLKFILTADCAHWGSPPSRTSFVFDSMLRLSYFLGNYYPEGSSQKFADELAFCFQQSGGTIGLRSHVEKINIKDNEVEGVSVTMGPLSDRRTLQIKSRIVISNADIKLTHEHLIDQKYSDPNIINNINKYKRTYPCYLMHIGLKDVDINSLDRAHGYYWRDWDTERVGKDALIFKLFPPTLFDPNVAPANKQVLIVQKVMDIDYQKIGDWKKHKEDFEAMLKFELNKVLPNILDNAEVCLTATAQTSYRYTLNEEGAMLGWEMSPEQLGGNRPSLDCGIKNLFFTGHWTQPGGGITPVIISAYQVAQKILGNKINKNSL